MTRRRPRLTARTRRARRRAYAFARRVNATVSGRRRLPTPAERREARRRMAHFAAVCRRVSLEIRRERRAARRAPRRAAA